MNTMKVGYARADITPLESVPLRGYGSTSNRMSDNVLDPLYATCLAFSFGEQTILLFGLDLCATGDVWPERIRPALSKAVGLAEECIFASSTHTHSGPDTANDDEPSIPRYFDHLEQQVIVAAKEALADQKPATMFTASAQTKALNFVRRYILEDGTPAGDNYGHFNLSPIKCHETLADPTMQFIKFVREGGKDVLMVNFQTHPHRTGGSKRYDVSADIVGAMRKETEQRLGCQFVYFTGGSGNVNPTSRIKEENVYSDYLDHGKAMADIAVSVEGHYIPAQADHLRFTWNQLNCPADHTQDHLAKEGERIYREFARTGDRETWTAEAKRLGFNSVYHAGAVNGKSKRPQTLEVPLAALSLGDVGFVFSPYEMFDTNGKYIKENSPFKMTFVLTCANRSNMGYVPSKLGFENGGYSSDACWFLPGAGERFADEFVDMLHELKQGE